MHIGALREVRILVKNCKTPERKKLPDVRMRWVWQRVSVSVWVLKRETCSRSHLRLLSNAAFSSAGRLLAATRWNTLHWSLPPAPRVPATGASLENSKRIYSPKKHASSCCSAVWLSEDVCPSKSSFSAGRIKPADSAMCVTKLISQQISAFASLKWCFCMWAEKASSSELLKKVRCF